MPAPPQFMAEWVKMADKLVGLAAEDEARGRALLRRRETEARRRSIYLTAERMQGHGHPGRGETYAKALDAFTARHRASPATTVERVEIRL